MARPKGTLNHQTKAIKDMIRQALDELGGYGYLVEQGRANPTAFMTLIGKTIPTDVQGHIVHSFFDKHAQEKDE